MARPDHPGASRAEVEAFLIAFKKVPHHRRTFFPRKDRDYVQDLAEIGGLDQTDANEVIDRLTVEHYWKGPAPDLAYPQHDVWWFGCVVRRRTVLIKLRLTIVANPELGNRGVIWSFHLADPAMHPITYPYRT